MIEIFKNVSSWLVFATGCGGLLLLLCSTWNYLFTYFMNTLEIKREFINYIWDKKRRGKKIFKPEINKVQDKE